jgi:hypothetical protein
MGNDVFSSNPAGESAFFKFYYSPRLGLCVDHIEPVRLRTGFFYSGFGQVWYSPEFIVTAMLAIVSNLVTVCVIHNILKKNKLSISAGNAW